MPTTWSLSPTRFATTRWSVVIDAAGSEDGRARTALSWLCEAYWKPLCAHVQRRCGNAETAQDLVQDFFARVLEKRDLRADPTRGRFRSYLLAAVDHFLANARDRARAAKRGGGVVHVAIDNTTEGVSAETSQSEQAFARDWALAMIERAMAALANEHSEAGKTNQFTTLRPFIAENASSGAYAEAGSHIGLNEGAVKVAVHRLRKRFGEKLRQEVAETVADPHDEAAIEAELAELRAALRR